MNLNSEEEMTEQQIRKAIEEQTGIKLYRTPYTTGLPIDAGVGGYINKLYGPYADTGDVRIFVNYQSIQGRHVVQLLVQDKDDDVFLNSRAEGAERYNVGIIHLTPNGQTVHP